jgi:ABC-type dipeptide/oligopeptide/nickel transport system ATPase subunit
MAAVVEGVSRDFNLGRILGTVAAMGEGVSILGGMVAMMGEGVSGDITFR